MITSRATLARSAARLSSRRTHLVPSTSTALRPSHSNNDRPSTLRSFATAPPRTAYASSTPPSISFHPRWLSGSGPGDAGSASGAGGAGRSGGDDGEDGGRGAAEDELPPKAKDESKNGEAAKEGGSKKRVKTTDGYPEAAPGSHAGPLSSSRSSSSSAGSPGSGGAASSSSDGGDSSSGSGTTSITKPFIPSEYPLVLALPITRRPLFPGLYKPVVIRHPGVVAAIKESIKRGQPYIGAFMFKDDNADGDVIDDIEQVHKVGVFAQIAQTYPVQGENGEEGGITAVLYPHRRIRIEEILPVPKKAEEGETKDGEVKEGEEKKEEVLKPTSVEEPVEAVGDATDAVESTTVEPADRQQPSAPTSSTTATTSPQASFLHNFPVSLARVTNMHMQKSPPEATTTPTVGEDASKSAEDTPSTPADGATTTTTTTTTTGEAQPTQSQVTRAIMTEIISVLKDIATHNPLFRDQIANFSMTMVSSASSVFDSPGKLADFAAAVSSGESRELQDVLESMIVEDRLQKALVVIKKELTNAQLQNKIARDVEARIQKRQREYYLSEQLKWIKKELGMEADGKDKIVEKFKEKRKELNMEEGGIVEKTFDEELSKLMGLEPISSEFNVTRSYLEWLTAIPWGRHSEDSYDLVRARKILDDDHYGLKDVKDRILEFLAVGKLRGTVEGKIILLVGPPGVGKTSLGTSVARALNRQFFRFSVGGLTDVAEIKGHRRTYVGAMPGKIIQALKKCGTENPLVMIDEIDKVGKGINGDPASALLEMLDATQNNAFMDHYMDVPVDLSHVLFVCTANMLDTIPGPLLDRLEVIEVNGYVSDEKAAIAGRYLSPQAKDASGLKNADVNLTPEAIDVLIHSYCRESGVRKLKQQIEKVYRKAALKIVQDLGEDQLPEAAAETVDAPNDTSEVKEAETETSGTDPKPNAPASTSSGSSDAGSTDSSASSSSSSTSATSEGEQPKEETKTTKTTTQVRKPLEVPSSVHVEITPDTLVEYVGPAVYQKDRIYTKRTPPGVSHGLGYLGNGSGAVMPIEATVMPGNGNIQLTGKLGEVIRESAQIALSFLKTHAYALGLTKSETEDLLEKKSIHLHMPEGGIGKEGPSAGTALMTAFTSLFSKRGVRSDLAMTGEVTLAGQVLAVGGTQEKLLAARRAGMKTVLVPADNRADIEYKVADSVKEGLELIYCQDVRDVFRVAFAGTDLEERIQKLEVFDLEGDPATIIDRSGEVKIGGEGKEKEEKQVEVIPGK